MNEKTLIIVNGYPLSGKDSFMDHYSALWRSTGLTVVKHSTIDTVKKIASKMGWRGQKTPENRVMLSELKDFYTKHFEGPLNEIKTLMTKGIGYYDPLGGPEYRQVDMLLVAMREPAEIRKTVKWAVENNITVQTFLIRGVNEEIDHSSHSDAKVLEYDYGLTFTNHGTLADFEKKIKDFFEYMVK